MKHRIKQSLLAMLVAFVSLTASAYDFEVDGFYYNKLTDSSVEVTYMEEWVSTDTYTGDLVIPASITVDGTTYAVTGIGIAAFYGCELTSVTIPEGITSIGEYAFQDCYGLTSITIPSSVTSIGASAFYECEALTSVTIPEGVTSIAEYTFYGCTGLTSVTISEGSFQSNGTFESCTGLTSVTFINGALTDIGDYAFKGCSGLKKIICHSATVPALGDEIFYGVPSDCVLHLPNGGAEAYKADSQFGVFLNMDVNVTDAEWATGCLTYTAKAPAGTAYYMKKVTGDMAVLEEFPDGLIPACEGFIYKNSEGTATFTDADATPAEVGNLLKGTAEAITVDDNSIYVLGKDHAGEVGIRLYTGTTLSGNKAYMDKDLIPAEAKSLRFVIDGETTGIEENIATAVDSDSAPIYNLQGQRIATPQRGQIYIQNNKKFIK